MFKRYSVQVQFKSGAHVESFTRAHNVTDALSQLLPLFNQADALISVVAKEVPGEKAQTVPPPPPSSKAPGVKKANKKAAYAGPNGQATDKD